jgi:hypothetical protein
LFQFIQSLNVHGTRKFGDGFQVNVSGNADEAGLFKLDLNILKELDFYFANCN